MKHGYRIGGGKNNMDKQKAIQEKRLRELIKTLPIDQQHVVILKLWGQRDKDGKRMSWREIGAEVGISGHAAEMRFHRAKLALVGIGILTQ